MPGRAHFIKSRSFGAVITMAQLPRQFWNGDVSPFPGQILLLRQRSLGRLALEQSYRILIRVDQRLGLRRWVTRPLLTGRVLSYARILVERTVDSLARFARPRILYRRPDPAPRPPATATLPDLRPSPRRSVLTGPEGQPTKPPPRREDPAVSTLRRSSLYDRWSRR